MKTTSLGPILSVTGALVAMVPMTVSAQDYFREYGTSRSSGGFGPVTPGDYTYRDISPSGLQPLDDNAVSESEHADNFAIGPVRFSIAAGVGVEFNDNITLSDNNRESDVIIRPLASIDAIWRVSEMNTLRLSLGISYSKYLDHTQYDSDSVIISPTSALEFTFKLGEVKFTLRDRFSYQEDPYDIPQLTGVAQYGRYENQIGIKAEYDFNDRARIEAGYDHYNLWSKQSEFSDQDRAIDTIFVKPSYGITQDVRLGLNATYSFISFDSSDRSDGNALLVGPYIEWQVTPNTNAYLEAGYQSLTFDGAYTPTRLIDAIDRDLTREQINGIRAGVADSDDSNSYYVRAEIDNKPSDVYKHRLSFSKTAEIGFYSDFYDLYHVEYDAEYTGIRKVSIGPSVFYEHYETSGQLGEKADRVGALLGARYYWTNSLTVGLDYRFLVKESNIENADYYQNLVFLSLYYKF
jgi:hypothetical protein